MISLIEVFTQNERNFARSISRKDRRGMGKILAKGSSMKKDLADGFGGPKQHYQRSFEKLALRKAGYKTDVRYLGKTPTKPTKSTRRAA